MSAMKHNLRALHLAGAQVGRDATRPPVMAATIKKDAYGLGAATVAHRLVLAGAQMLCVYNAEEAEALVDAAVQVPILIYMPVHDITRTGMLYRHAAADKLHLSVHDLDQLKALNEVGQTLGLRLPVHLYVDTGMSRGGLSEGGLQAVVTEPGRMRYLRLAGVYTHFATSDTDPEFLAAQHERFMGLIQKYEQAWPETGVGGVLRHCANSAAVLRGREYHLDLIRPGLGLHGYTEATLAPGPVIGSTAELKHVVRWVSSLVHVGAYKRRTPVGYGCTHKLKRESLLGLVPVGYGDGYPLALSGKAMVGVQSPAGDWGHAKVLGRVNMDQIVVDLTDLLGEGAPVSEGLAEVWKGADVELVSPDAAQPNALPKLAELAKSHCYEMLCGLGKHLPRRYVG